MMYVEIMNIILQIKDNHSNTHRPFVAIHFECWRPHQTTSEHQSENPPGHISSHMCVFTHTQQPNADSTTEGPLLSPSPPLQQDATHPHHSTPHTNLVAKNANRTLGCIRESSAEVEGCDPAPLLSPGEVTSEVPCPVLASWLQKSDGAPEAGPA